MKSWRQEGTGAERNKGRGEEEWAEKRREERSEELGGRVERRAAKKTPIELAFQRQPKGDRLFSGVPGLETYPNACHLPIVKT